VKTCGINRPFAVAGATIRVRLLAAMTNCALAITAARTPMLAWHRDVAEGIVRWAVRTSRMQSSLSSCYFGTPRTGFSPIELRAPYCRPQQGDSAA
jgi:hypothetical protein